MILNGFLNLLKIYMNLICRKLIIIIIKIINKVIQNNKGNCFSLKIFIMSTKL